jgi:hypothetical protein
MIIVPVHAALLIGVIAQPHGERLGDASRKARRQVHQHKHLLEPPIKQLQVLFRRLTPVQYGPCSLAPIQVHDEGKTAGTPHGGIGKVKMVTRGRVAQAILGLRIKARGYRHTVQQPTQIMRTIMIEAGKATAQRLDAQYLAIYEQTGALQVCP